MPSESKPQRKTWYEASYRKAKDTLYASTGLSTRGGVYTFIGMTAYALVWATWLTFLFAVWLLSFGGRLFNHYEETLRTLNYAKNQPPHQPDCPCYAVCGKTSYSN